MPESAQARQRVEEIIPSAARTVASLRDIGYDAPRAIADLVDNSLAAGASQVAVELHFAGANSSIKVTDNGRGMDAATLLEAMRYGSRREYEIDDLGKFGFGLKTASTSQCRRLTVASRRSQESEQIDVLCLDLDHIERTNQWEVLVLEGASRPPQVTEPLQMQSGTVVLWEDLDRILEYKDPWGEWARKRLLALAQDIDLHLGAVFHRFLAGEVPDRRLQVTVNGSLVEPWDPFCRSEPQTEQLPAKDFVVGSDNGPGIVRVRPYVLPRQADFSSEAAWRRASGVANWNRQQGLYIYRAHRLIQSGGWNRLRTSDEHTKLARVSLEFFPSLDSTFGINIAKAYVNLPDDLRAQLEPVVSQVARVAEQRYRSTASKGNGGPRGGASRPRGVGTIGGGSPASGTKGGAGGPGLGTKAGTGGPEAGTGPVWPTPRPWPRQAIEDAASRVGQQGALDLIIEALRERYPKVAHDLGW